MRLVSKNDVDRVYDSRYITKNGQQDVEPEMQPNPNFEKHPDGRQEDCEKHFKYFVTPGLTHGSQLSSVWLGVWSISADSIARQQTSEPDYL